MGPSMRTKLSLHPHSLRNSATHESTRGKSKKSKSPANWPVTYRLAAMGTLVAYTAFGATKISLARPQHAGTDDSGQYQTAGSPRPVRPFDIPAGTIESAMTAFEAATHIHITFSDEGIRSLASPELHGLLTD